MRAALLISLLSALAGCTTQAEREVARMNSVTERALADMDACSARTEASGPFRQLKAKLPPTDGSAPSPALLADRSRPTVAQAALLVELHAGYMTPCRRLVVDRLAAINPAFAAVAATSFADADADYARLVRGEASWGEYAGASQLRRLTFLQAFSAAGERVNRDLAESHLHEVRQRQASAMARWDRQQQIVVDAGMGR